MSSKPWTSTIVIVGTLFAGCGGDQGSESCAVDTQGSLQVTIYGEEFIEDRIPNTVFVDGWEVIFDEFLVHIRSVTAARGSCSPDINADAGWLFDLSRPSEGDGHEVLTAEVPTGLYDNVSYRIGPASGDIVAGNADPADRASMLENGYAVFVSGAAHHSAHGTRTFAWGLPDDTVYAQCESNASVAEGQRGGAQLTIHADHLFYDDLVSADPDVSFDLFAAADSDGDHEITAEELSAQSVIGQDRYSVGNYTAVTNLWQFVQHLVGTTGHIDGEGHCHTEP